MQSLPVTLPYFVQFNLGYLENKLEGINIMINPKELNKTYQDLIILIIF
jgi:hypothetical protein